MEKKAILQLLLWFMLRELCFSRWRTKSSYTKRTRGKLSGISMMELLI